VGVLRFSYVAVLAALAVMLAAPASASAAPKGPVAVFDAGALPAGVAVDQDSGDVYVVDAASDLVQRFDADGGLISTFGGVGTGTGLEGEFFFGGSATGVAVDQTTGDVYVADTYYNRVQKFDAAGNFILAFGLDVDAGDPGDPNDPAHGTGFEVCTTTCQFGTADSSDGAMSGPLGVTVDPTSGDVLVADTNNNRVQRFDSNGGYLSQFNNEGALSPPARLAVDSTGAIYVGSDPNYGEQIKKFDSSGTFLENLSQAPASPTDVLVDAATDHVFVVGPHDSGSVVGELDADGVVVDTHLSPAAHPVPGLAVSSTGRIYVSDYSTARVFILDDPVQTATIDQPSDDAVGSRTATLTGTVNPQGGLPVGYHFEVSSDQGQTWTLFPIPDEQIGGGDSDIPVDDTVPDLERGRDYLARLVVSNEYGSTVISDETTFTTDPEPPDVETLPAAQIQDTGALLTGEVNPGNVETTYHFEWGNSTAYGTSIPVPEASAGAGGSPVVVGEQLDGLLPNTVYHYRLVATNLAGTTEGDDRAFRTRPVANAPDGRGYELVSPAYKVAGVGVGHWYGGPDAVGLVGYAAHDAERFGIRGQSGAMLLDSGAFAFVSDWVLAERTSAGWVNKPGVSRRAHGPMPTTEHAITGASPDMSLTAWGSAAQMLKPFPEMELWDSNDFKVLLLRRWTEPQVELFGPTDPSQDVPTTSNDSVGNGPKAVAADGSAVVVTAPGTRGLAGPRDPTRFDNSPAEADNVYLDEVTGPFSDVFPGDDGVRELVNVCTAGTVLPTASGSEPCPPPLPDRDRLISSGGASLKVDSSPPGSVISEDGSRVFFMSPDPDVFGAGPSQLFVRQRSSNNNVVTRWISQTEVDGQATSLRAPAVFEGASRDGDKVFFRTASPLTEDDPNSGCGAPCTTGAPSNDSNDLYMYDLPDGPDGNPATPDDDPAGGSLSRISAGPGADADCDVQTGTLRWLSDDAARAYFTCAAPLAGDPAPSNGTVTAPGGTPGNTDGSNLYVYDAMQPVAEQWSFIARLPRGGVLAECATSGTGRGSFAEANPGGTGYTVTIGGRSNCVRGTRDGSLVTFFTGGRLTSDDPDTSSGDIYGYDISRNELMRLSAAEGVGAEGSYPCEPGNDATSERCHADGGIGAGPMPLEMLGVGEDTNGDRSAFFESRSRLVSEDGDDSYDVYQWRDGELSLVSVGVSDPDGAFYVGNDRSGRNVYIATRDQLTWQDSDRVLDVYTARVGGGFPAPQPATPCPILADGCRGGGADQVRPQPDTDAGTNASLGQRKTLSLRRLTSAQRARAARTGRISLRVRASGPGRLSVAARAMLKGSVRVVGRASNRVVEPGLVTVNLRLGARARAVLGRGRALRVTLQVSQPGAKPRSMTVRLRRATK
jgi:DNA-binding beta-propeller fold protein YncE